MPSLLNKDYDIDSNTQKLANRGRQKSNNKIMKVIGYLTDAELSEIAKGIDKVCEGLLYHLDIGQAVGGSPYIKVLVENKRLEGVK